MINSNSFSNEFEKKEFKNADNIVNSEMKIYIKKYLIILINISFVILIIIYIVANKKSIKKLEKSFESKIKLLEYKNYLLNFQIEAFFSYLNTIKNESSIFQIIKPKEVIGKEKVRIGGSNDGGYVLLNDFEKIKIAYSFGISDDISFDKELADKNIDVFMYDHTIEKLPFSNPKFHWKKIGLSASGRNYNKMKTLNNIIKENGHENEKNMILKIDIEGDEWKVLYNIKEEILTQFKYIIIEFHFIIEFKAFFVKVFKKMNKTHQIFHLHCNNFGSLINFDNNYICSTLEASYIIKENNSFLKLSSFFPIKNIDFINDNNSEDYNNFLNIYQIDNVFPME